MKASPQGWGTVGGRESCWVGRGLDVYDENSASQEALAPFLTDLKTLSLMSCGTLHIRGVLRQTAQFGGQVLPSRRMARGRLGPYVSWVLSFSGHLPRMGCGERWGKGSSSPVTGNCSWARLDPARGAQPQVYWHQALKAGTGRLTKGTKYGHTHPTGTTKSQVKFLMGLYWEGVLKDGAVSGKALSQSA